MRRRHQINAADNITKEEQITAKSISPHIIKLCPTNITKADLKKENLLYEQNSLYLPLE